MSAPQPTRGSAERRELPQRGPGRSPGRYRVHFLQILGHRTLLVAEEKYDCLAQSIRKNCKFHFEKVVVTVTTTFKSGGDKSPSSHTKLRLCPEGGVISVTSPFSLDFGVLSFRLRIHVMT